MTIEQALKEGNSILKANGIDTPALDAGLLLAEALHTDRSKLVVNAKETISEEDYLCYKKFLERRLSGECIAYILGKKEFYGLDFYVNPSVLVPRPDTETLVEAGLDVLKEQGAGSREQVAESREQRILDLCTGSGAVAIALKHERPELEVWASDLSADALAVAHQNGDCHHFDITFIESDLFEKINSRFHLIISNPPYVASGEIASLAPEVRREPRLALDGGQDGLNIIRRIIAGAKNHLVPGGCLLMEADPGQMETIRQLLLDAGFEECKTYKDLAGKERIVSAVCPPGLYFFKSR